MKKINVLFLCISNSSRSPLAEAFLRAYAGDRYEAFSAGVEPGELHPLTRQVMAEVGIDISGQHAKPLKEYMGKKHFGFLITVCSEAEARCPKTFPGMGNRLHWNFEDPAAYDGSEENKLLKFRVVRDQISRQIKDWLEKQE